MFTLKNTLRTAAIALPVTFFGVAAQAGGLSEPVAEPVFVAPTPAPVMVASGRDWTGFYAGGSLGYADLEGDDLGDDFSGLVYGGHAGYNYDFGSYVIGAELEGTFGDIDDGAGIDFENVLRAKVRAGYDAGAFLPYVTAGYAQATVSADGTDIDDDGYFYGAGVDYAFTDNITVGAEVLQHEFEDFNDGSDVSALTGGLRVSYNF